MSTLKLFLNFFLKIILFCAIAENKNLKFFQQSKMVKNTGTEELAHLEMVGTLVNQLTDGTNAECVKKSGFADYFINHSTGVYPANTNGSPFNAMAIAVSGDPITDLNEDLAAEQKARATYNNILRLSDDPDVNDVIKFLREREIVHYQRFGEALRRVYEKLNEKNKFYMNHQM